MAVEITAQSYRDIAHTRKGSINANLRIPALKAAGNLRRSPSASSWTLRQHSSTA